MNWLVLAAPLLARISLPSWPSPLISTASWGYVRLRLETYSEGELAQWAQRLQATAWQNIHVYFMHEPTAPGHAQTLMRLVAQ